MNERLLLIGGGGHCKSVLDAALRMNVFKEIVITDNSLPAGSNVLGCKVIGTDDLLPEMFHLGFTQACLTVGSIKSASHRRAVYQKAKAIGYKFLSIADPSAVAAQSAKIGNGVFIGKNSVINSNAVIGDMAIINTGAVIEHDCHIGKFSHIAAGAVVCGGAELADDVFVGANATIIQGVKIGRKSIIGAGSIILADVPESSTVVGMSCFKKRGEDYTG